MPKSRETKEKELDKGRGTWDTLGVSRLRHKPVKVLEEVVSVAFVELGTGNGWLEMCMRVAPRLLRTQVDGSPGPWSIDVS